MNKKRIKIIIISITILLILFVILPFILLNTAESKLDNIKSFNKSPENNFYLAMKLLNISKISPFFNKQANDLMIHFTLKYMGEYKIQCQNIVFDAKKNAIDDMRIRRDKEIDNAGGNLKKREAIRKKYDFMQNNLKWKKWVKTEVKTAFCNSWKNFIIHLKKKKVKIDCSICTPL